MSIKTTAKSVLCGLYKYSGVMSTQEAVARWQGRSFASILLYHRVTDQIPEDGLTVSTDRFRRTCQMLRRSFRVVSLSELMSMAAAGETIPPRTVAITFDDCYRDNLVAARTLAEYQLPACFFIPTQYVGTDHVFDWDRDLPKMANLSWDEVREMASLGHEIGSHTITHPNMAAVSMDQARDELVVSKQTLEQQLDQPIRWFAYPFGQPEHFTTERVALVKEAGYEAVFSGFGGFVYAGKQYPIVPREPTPYFKSLLNMELHLRGCLQWYYRLKKYEAPVHTI